MLKKILLGTLLTGLVAVLIWGAINRTNATGNQAAGEGGHHGRGATSTATETIVQGNGGRWSEDAQSAAGRGGRWNESAQSEVGRGGGRWAQGGRSADALSGAPLADTQPDEWMNLQGEVISAADDLIEIRAADGTVIPFEGQPLRYALAQGLQLQVGDRVELAGFYEDGEFKIGKVTDLNDQMSITLRDTGGRPGWSGRGRRG